MRPTLGPRLALAATALVATATHAAVSEPPSAQERAAREALARLKAMADESHYALLGFATADEVPSAVLGMPWRVTYVAESDLRSFRPGDNPASLLRDSHVVTYPVLVNDVVRSTACIRELPGGSWRPAAYGDRGPAGELARLRDRACPPGRPGECLEVGVPDLDLLFLGRLSDGSLTVQLVRGAMPSLRVDDEFHPAGEVFAILAGLVPADDSGARQPSSPRRPRLPR